MCTLCAGNPFNFFPHIAVTEQGYIHPVRSLSLYVHIFVLWIMFRLFFGLNRPRRKIYAKFFCQGLLTGYITVLYARRDKRANLFMYQKSTLNMLKSANEKHSVHERAN